MLKKLLIIGLLFAFLMAACSPSLEQPNSAASETEDPTDREPGSQKSVPDVPKFIPDYKEGEQNTVWGNTPSNISLANGINSDNLYYSIARQSGYLYYSLFKDGAIYKMPVGATSAEDIQCILPPNNEEVNIGQIQVLGDWLYFARTFDHPTINQTSLTVLRMRTDGTLLEEIFTLEGSVYGCGGFIVYKDRIYYTETEKVNITADTYAHKSKIMSCALDGTDIRCDLSIDKGLDGFSISCYDPNGYLYLYSRKGGYSGGWEWMLYSLEDKEYASLCDGYFINVGWDSTTYTYFFEGDGLITTNGWEYTTDILRGNLYASYIVQGNLEAIKGSDHINQEIGYFEFDKDAAFNADDSGFYFNYHIGLSREDIGYFNHKTNEISTVCPDEASCYFLPGDGYLYYNSSMGWCRIAVDNGQMLEGSWEQIDWMRGT